MSGPGSGRYTTYVPTASARNTLLRKLFNNKAQNDAGNFYGSPDQTNNIEAAKAVVARATQVVQGGVGGIKPSDGKQAGDPQMFPSGVNLAYGGSPDLNDVKWKNAGDPANAFAPDVSSPGPGKTSPLDKSSDPGLSVKDMKGEAYIPGAPDTGTQSPSTTSPVVGSAPFGKPLTMGKSSV